MSMLSKCLFLLLLVTTVTAISGCGKTGPLYLPHPAPPKAPAHHSK